MLYSFCCCFTLGHCMCVCVCVCVSVCVCVCVVDMLWSLLVFFVVKVVENSTNSYFLAFSSVYVFVSLCMYWLYFILLYTHTEQGSSLGSFPTFPSPLSPL